MSQRQDGRQEIDIRPISIEFGELSGVDGSARFGFGETKVLTSVSGPIEVRAANENPSKATLEVIVRPLAGVTGTESKALASTLRSAITPSLHLTQNPRTLVQIVAQSLTYQSNSTVISEETGLPTPLRFHPSIVASLLNASSLALMNTGSLPMLGVLCAVGIGRLRKSRALIVDPSEEEFNLLDGGGCFAFLASSKQGSVSIDLAWMNWNANGFSEEELFHAQQLAQKAAGTVWEHMKGAIVRVVNPEEEFTVVGNLGGYSKMETARVRLLES